MWGGEAAPHGAKICIFRWERFFANVYYNHIKWAFGKYRQMEKLDGQLS
jgi:hypothetical protein